MTNKPVLSVERELLQSALNAVEYLALRGDDVGLSNEPVAKELRALLDKPSESVIDLDALDWESVKEAAAESKWMPPEYMRNDWVADVCAFLRSERTVQHHGEVDGNSRAPRQKGEPVGWQFFQHGKWWNGVDTNNHRANTEGAGLQVRDVYAEQPAPVALTIPEECPHIIVFDDADLDQILFAGTGARAAALKTWEQISRSWNAHLFVRVERNSRDDRYPSALSAPVAVVMPAEDCGTYDYGSYNEGHKHGWNDCLEEVTRLNGVKS